MGTPTEEELKQALQCAVEMREKGNDSDFLAKSLLNHHYRLKKMEQIITSTKLYLRSGESSTEHAKLVKALEQYERIDRETPSYTGFGLE